MKPESFFDRFKTLIVASGHGLPTVEIPFKSRTARTVMLIGDFVGSQFSPLPLCCADDGTWRIQLRLTPGCYCYQFVVDGALMNDSLACGMAANKSVTRNQVVEVAA